MLFTEDRGNKSQVIGFILLGLAKGILGKVSKRRAIFAFNLRGGGGIGVINPKLHSTAHKTWWLIAKFIYSYFYYVFYFS